MPRPVDMPHRSRKSYDDRNYDNRRESSSGSKRYSTPGSYVKVSYRDAYGHGRSSNGDYRKHNGRHHDDYKRRDRDRDRERRSKEKENKKPKELLPVEEMADLVEKKIKKEDFVIFVSETGSGKSTKIPQIVIDRVFKDDPTAKVAVSQPRRVAALNLARRVAHERNCEVGDEVGYKFRFENETSEKTRITYMTDGILLREILYDKELKNYKCVIIDEVHERSVDTDILLFLLQRLRKRSNLKIILMSAYMDVEGLKQYYNGVEAYFIPGRSFEIETHFLPQPADDYLDLTLRTVYQLHQSEPTTHAFLVFLTGQEEIVSALRALRKAIPDADIIAFYAALGHDRPKIFEVSKERRKIVIATNIAETSITIPDVRVVVDCGKVKQKWTTKNLRLDQLVINDVSKAQAIQRAGRAGRTGPGKCFRLYTKQQYDAFLDQTVPEVERCNLSHVTMMLIDMGFAKLSKIKLLNNPPKTAWAEALFELYSLHLIQLFDGLHKRERREFYDMSDDEKVEQTYALTSAGNKIRPLPVTPQLGHFILQCAKEEITQTGIQIACLCSITEEMFLSLREDMDEATKARIQHERDSLLKNNTSDLVAIMKIIKMNRKMDEKEWKKREKDKQLNPKFFKEITQLRRQLTVQCESKKVCDPKKDKLFGQELEKPLNKAIVESFFLNTCIQTNDKEHTYYLLLDPSVKLKIHPSSILMQKYPKMFVFNELVKTNENYAKLIHPIDPELLLDKLKTLDIPGLLERIKGG
ncbi:unnamed protein product [Bursaphelenchus xylophilus]|uniref:RNA helicase n=1 Tax=Bursaphelenchus xylophilus TaxID=6326 RepID=A0A1I7RWX7_BURXY|nr:unnamed protein product [Bursaphelenchus xylophilus]CAG9121187.1 unnamed protein product [Bursaphelenchus xylophilus]